MAQPEALAVARIVAQVLEELGIAYYLGGSLASSFHGIPRATEDADLVADLRLEHVGASGGRRGVSRRRHGRPTPTRPAPTAA